MDNGFGEAQFQNFTPFSVCSQPSKNVIKKLVYFGFQALHKTTLTQNRNYSDRNIDGLSGIKANGIEVSLCQVMSVYF